MDSDFSLFNDVIPSVHNVETLQEALKLYELVGMPAKNLAERTRREYRNDLTYLIEYLLEKRGVTHVAQVSLTDLEAYQAEMDTRAFASSTRERKTHAIKAFFKFLYRQEVTTTDVSSRLIPPSPQKKEPRFLSKDEYQRLLRSVGHNPRDYAIIETYLQTGMRLSELARLKIVDLDIPKRISKDEENVGLARVTRKGGKSEGVVLNYKACQALSSYLRARPPVAHPYVFVSKFQRPLSKRSIQHMITKHLEDCGITGASVHTLRHTFATHHVANGTDLKTVQETLVVDHYDADGYRRFSFARAFLLVKRHWTVALTAFRSASQAAVLACTSSADAIRVDKHWRWSTANSHSAMLSHEPCLGV